LAAFVLHAHTHFTLVFVLGKGFVFGIFALLLLLNNFRSQVIHKLLSTALSLLELSLAVLLLTIKHPPVFSKSLHVVFLFGSGSLLSFSFVSLVFSQHALEILALLSSLLDHHASLMLHLGLQSLHQLALLGKLLLLLLLTAEFFVIQLSITALFLESNFLALGSNLFHFTLAKQLDVLFLQLFIHASFIDFVLLAGLLFHDLTIKLLLNQSAALLFSYDRLLLFFVVDKSIEFLDCRPLVVFRDFAVDLSFCMLAGQLAQVIAFLTFASDKVTRRLRAMTRACN
jgi:hypothetical protein